MNVLEAMATRRSVRRFSNEPVPIEDIREMVRHAAMAPSVNNCQPWQFLAITDTELLRKMGEAVADTLDTLFPDAALPRRQQQKATIERLSTFFMQAPCVVAMLQSPHHSQLDTLIERTDADPELINDLRRFPGLQSVGAATQNLLLAAHAMGYGACWVSGVLVARQKLEALLGVEPPQSLASFIAIGHTASTPSESERKPLDEVFRVIGE